MTLVVGVDELEARLHRIDGRGYKAYRELRGLSVDYGFASARLTKIQGDPYATPSIIEAEIRAEEAGIDQDIIRNGKIAVEDYIARLVYRRSSKHRRRCGSGNSCYLGYPAPGPWMLKRSSVEIHGDRIIVRMYVGLPAAGRRILGREASRLLCRDVPAVLGILTRINEEKLRRHVENYLDQEYLREWLYKEGYATFIGDGSILPRASSLTEEPMRNAIPFKSPPQLRVSIDLPSGRRISGMALGLGVNLITGGGYHGKTTLLEAIQQGIYNHIEGDGREFVVSRRATVSIRAEDGRLVHSVDISSLIGELPGGTDTKRFSSLDASGSTSMAASISEALESGAELILIDEDTSATNLLFKDNVMSSLIKHDPIKPLSFLARSLYETTGTSLIVIAGASSAFIPASDRVILMEKYVPRDVTREAKTLLPGTRRRGAHYAVPRTRTYKGIRGLTKIRARGFRLIAKYLDGAVFELDVDGNPRMVEAGQARFIARIIEKLSKLEKPMPVPELVETIDKSLLENGFKAYVTGPMPPDLTMVAGIDVVWVLNRFRNAVFE